MLCKWWWNSLPPEVIEAKSIGRLKSIRLMTIDNIILSGIYRYFG